MVPRARFRACQDRAAPLASRTRSVSLRSRFHLTCVPEFTSARSRDAIQNRAKSKSSCPRVVYTPSRAAASEFRASLQSEPFLAWRPFVGIYIVLGVLYESYLHPITILSKPASLEWAHSWLCDLSC